MGQEFHVLRCFSCQSFQVHQVKKVNKWSCKLCGEKQSLLKEFGRGSAANCRRHVQKLNAMRGAVMEVQECHAWSLWEQKQQQQEEEEEQSNKQVRQAQVRQPQVSRWSKYLDTPEEAEPEENHLVNRKQLDGSKMTDRKRKRAKEAGPEDSHTPEQLDCLKPQTPSATATCSPSPCSVATRWARFLSPDCREEEEPDVCGQTQSLGDQSNSGIIGRPRSLLPASSMFESGEEFNFDDDFQV